MFSYLQCLYCRSGIWRDGKVPSLVGNGSFLLGSFCWNFFSTSGTLSLSAFNRPGTQKIFSFATKRLDV